jgi:hypothetical protein
MHREILNDVLNWFEGQIQECYEDVSVVFDHGFGVHFEDEMF